MSAATPHAPPAVPPAGDPDFVPSTLAGATDVRQSSAVLDAALFTGGTYLAHAIQFVTGLITKALLGPLLAGYWALLQSFWTFMSLTSLGAQPGATRQVPMHRGRGDFRAAEQAAGTAATFALCSMAGTGLVLAVVAVVFGSSWAPELRFGLALLGVTAPLRLLTDTHEVLIQAVRRFDVASATVVVKALLTLVLQSLAVLAFGLYGMFLGIVLVELAGIVFWLRIGIISRRRPAFRPGIDRARLRELIRFGAPILVYAQVWLLFKAVDSFIVAGALSVRQLGFYALAVSVTAYVLYLPQAIGAAVFPRMAERFGRTGRLEDIQHYATDVQRILGFVLVPLAVAGGFFAFPVLIRHVLPEFGPAVGIVQIMVAASFFMALMSMPVKVLMTAGYRWSLTGIAFACLIVNAGLNLGAVLVLDLGLEGAAGATAISYLVTFLATTGFSLSRSDPFRTVAAHIGEIIVAFAYTYAALRGLEWLVGGADGFLADAGLAALKFVAFAVVLAPWVWLAKRRLGSLEMLTTPLRSVLRRVRRA